jgi:hypothetical protein
LLELLTVLDGLLLDIGKILVELSVLGLLSRQEGKSG